MAPTASLLDRRPQPPAFLILTANVARRSLLVSLDGGLVGGLSRGSVIIEVLEPHVWPMLACEMHVMRHGEMQKANPSVASGTKPPASTPCRQITEQQEQTFPCTLHAEHDHANTYLQAPPHTTTGIHHRASTKPYVYTYCPQTLNEHGPHVAHKHASSFPYIPDPDLMTHPSTSGGFHSLSRVFELK